jgi:uncharacterized protein with GYD domain
MPHYVILWNWTDQGIRSLKDSPKRLASFRAQLEKLGGNLVGEYYIMSILLGNASKGNFHSITLKAFPLSEAGKLIESI